MKQMKHSFRTSQQGGFEDFEAMLHLGCPEPPALIRVHAEHQDPQQIAKINTTLLETVTANIHSLLFLWRLLILHYKLPPIMWPTLMVKSGEIQLGISRISETNWWHDAEQV